MTALPPSAYWLHHHSSIAVDDVVPEDAGTRWSTRHTVVVVLCVLYVISPVDLLPEVILGPFGLADDGLALVFATFAALLGLRADSAERSDER